MRRPYQPLQYVQRVFFVHRSWRATPGLLVSLLLWLSGCIDPVARSGCDPDANTGCAAGQVCEPVVGAAPACFAPVLVRDQVFNQMVGMSSPIEFARVVALDEGGGAVSRFALTRSDGTYELRVVCPRDSSGLPVHSQISLRAEAAGHQAYPGPIRPKLLLDPASAASLGSALLLGASAADLGLFPLRTASRATIQGRIDAPVRAGVLITGGGSSALSDADGQFVLHNVTPGSITLRGYAAGQQLASQTVLVVAGGQAEVTLSAASAPLSKVSGSLSALGGLSSTSVMLMVKETFSENLERGEVPRGLRKTGVTADFVFEGVPDGEYIVMPAFDNDGATREPALGVQGTNYVSVTVPSAAGRDISLQGALRLTTALSVRSPGADQPEAVTVAKPLFTWSDDASEDGYEVRVLDSFGTLVWESLAIPKVTSSATASVTYAGPALVKGMYYLFSAQSYRMQGSRVALSRTEDQRGVFYLTP